MRVLFTTLPGAGPFHPLVPLAQALLQAGHEVAFTTSPSYCATIEAAGFRCFAAGYDWLVSVREPAYAHVRAGLADKESFSPFIDVYTDFLPSSMAPDLFEIAGSWRPDVVVREPMEFAGCVVAEALEIPHAACGPLFSYWQAAWHDAPGEVSKPNLDSLRRHYGLPPDPQLAMLHRYLYLAFLPPKFLHSDLAPPPTVHFLRPVSFNQSGTEVLPAWIARLPARPTVHASLGTVFHRTPGVFEAIIEGLRDQDINLIVAVGRDRDPAAFGVQPSNVRIEKYIPHTLLLPHCDAVITHGGFSSVMACIEQGLPLVAIPLAGGDQPGNSARCVALGIARVIGPEQRNPSLIRDAVLDVLRDRSYRDYALRVKQDLQSLPSVEHAVELLRRLVHEKVPTVTRQADNELRRSELKSKSKLKRATAERRVYRLGVRAETAAETARSILRATIDLYGKRFYDQVSLEDIAERAEVTVQTLIRRFGSKDELISAAADAARETIRSQRDETPVGDITGAAKALVDTYEAHGDRVLLMLAQEDRVPAFRLITDTGRAYHYEWVDRIFAPLLAKQSRRERERLRAQIIAVCDVYVWRILRRDLQMTSEETKHVVLQMLSALGAAATTK